MTDRLPETWVIIQKWVEKSSNITKIKKKPCSTCHQTITGSQKTRVSGSHLCTFATINTDSTNTIRYSKVPLLFAQIWKTNGLFLTTDKWISDCLDRYIYYFSLLPKAIFLLLGIYICVRIRKCNILKFFSTYMCVFIFCMELSYFLANFVQCCGSLVLHIWFC